MRFIPEFLSSGKSEQFNMVYKKAEEGVLLEFLLKYGMPDEIVKKYTHYYSSLESEEDKNIFLKDIIDELFGLGIEKPYNIFISLSLVKEELSELEKILDSKRNQLRADGLMNSGMGEKAEKLLEIAIRNRKLPPGSDENPSPYFSYYPISS